MSSVIQNILDNVVGDGARSSKFECLINFQAPIFDAVQDIPFLVKTSQFPGKTQEVIDLKFKGRTIPVKGQVKYDNTWTCTFYLTQDHLLKTAFENWIEAIDQVHNVSQELHNDIKTAQKVHVNNGYTIDMKIAQADFHGDQTTAIYNLYNVFPKSVSGIDVDYSGTGQISEFTVEFSYTHYDVENEKIDNSTYVDKLKSKAQSSIQDAINGIFGNQSSNNTDSTSLLNNFVSTFFGDGSVVKNDKISNMTSRILE